MTDIRLDRTFWPVGHGAFYTEQFRNAKKNQIFSAVYDCGAKDEDTVQRCVDYAVGKGNEIDYVFVSHFHRDHINGLLHLLNYSNIKHIVIPKIEKTRLIESYVYNAITAHENQLEDDAAQIFIRRQLNFSDMRVAQIIEVAPVNEGLLNEPRRTNIDYLTNIQSGEPIYVPENSTHPYWVYIPVNIDNDVDKRNELIKSLNKLCDQCYEKHVLDGGQINWDSISSLLKQKFNDVANAYKTIFKDHNSYSMPVFSGPTIFAEPMWRLFSCSFLSFMEHKSWSLLRHPRFQMNSSKMLSCLYMGDFEASVPGLLSKLSQTLGDYYNVVGLQQVPHHYSPYNHNIELFRERIMAFGNVNDHKDISFCHSTYDAIYEETPVPPLVITEENLPQRIRYRMHLQ